MNNMVGLVPPSLGSVDPLAGILSRRAVAGVIGLGYVGLPLIAATARAGFTTIGFDIDPAKPAKIAAAESYIDAVPSSGLAPLVQEGKLSATTDFTRLGEC